MTDVHNTHSVKTIMHIHNNVIIVIASEILNIPIGIGYNLYRDPMCLSTVHFVAPPIESIAKYEIMIVGNRWIKHYFS